MAVLVVGAFWGDALDALLVRQFSVVQREDANVVFTRAMSDRAVREIAHVPGVRLAEGVRAVPVRMEAGTREKRVDLLGLPEHSELRRLVGAEGASMALPPDGVVLSGHLARRLAIGVGGRVTIAVLEGRRARRDLTVAAIVDELIGMGAYVHIDALARLLGEPPTASAALVAVMPGQADAVHEALRALPEVATVSVKAAMVRKFEDTMMEIMLVFSLVLTTFGALVVVGIVYNGASILVAERSREVATLRVLGFSEGDVSALVLTELAIQIALGLPFGAALGYGLSAIAVRIFGPEDISIPLVIGPGTWVLAVATVLCSATVSALVARRRLCRLDSGRGAEGARMKRGSTRKAVLYAIGVAIVAGIVGAWVLARPRPDVEVMPLTRGAFERFVEEDGRARVRDRYLVASPVAGTTERTHFHVGDAVAQGDVVAVVVPAPGPLLEPRSRAELEEKRGAAEAALARARVADGRAEAARKHADDELERVRSLVRSGSLPSRNLDDAELEAQLATKEREDARFGVHMAEHQLDMTRAALGSAMRAGKGPTERVEIRAPVDGRVLKILQESESPVAAGTPLVELADPSALEVAVDLLSTDAVQVQAGAEAQIRGWGGPGVLTGRVRRVEPMAAVKVSALGVEEERVNVIVDPTGDSESWKRVGDGYRADVRIRVERIEGTLILPTSALFRERGDWYVYVVRDARAHKQIVHVRGYGPLQTAIDESLPEHERVVVQPSEAIGEGARVRPVPAPEEAPPPNAVPAPR